MEERFRGRMTKIKICGLKRPEDIEMANRLHPDYVGFVFAKSRRQIDGKMAEILRKELDATIPVVGVFVNAPLREAAELAGHRIIQLIQLHGDEDADYISDLRKEVPGIPLIKAVRVQTKEQILEAEKLDVDYLLLDTFVKDVYGGSGTSFDKSLIPPLSKPYFLAGGLTAENVWEQISACNPFAVDVSSAVETDGIKDEEKIRTFIERVRNHEQ